MLFPTLMLALAVQAAPVPAPIRTSPRVFDRLFVSQLPEEPPIVAAPASFAAMDAHNAEVEQILAVLKGAPVARAELRAGKVLVSQEGKAVRIPVRFRVHRCRGISCSECGTLQVRPMTEAERRG
jgi:hypothetical protein